MSEIITDSNMSFELALADNPADPCPPEILGSLSLLEVRYKGFDKQTHAGQIVVAAVVESEVRQFFRQAQALEFPIEHVVPAADPRFRWDDEKIMAANVSSGFNYRPIAGTDKLSRHSQGLAFDINPRQNPYIRYENGEEITQPPDAAWDKYVPGTLNANHPLVRMMESLGWEWGGNWAPESGRVDYQHFEKPL
ncbi:MAG TPA: M15 family metallopeptidase [Candidatus Saccharimonadales bacterium]|nr:M15 family metallopeptidase [Candidatus Saccharimonadales bacterium]